MISTERKQFTNSSDPRLFVVKFHSFSLKTFHELTSLWVASKKITPPIFLQTCRHNRTIKAASMMDFSVFIFSSVKG